MSICEQRWGQKEPFCKGLNQPSYDVLIIGAGLAGVITALSLPSSLRVAIVSKTKISDSSSYWAQGGLAGFSEDADARATHIADTLQCGCGLSDSEVVAHIIDRAHSAVAQLRAYGVDFSTNADGSLHLTREGGHSRDRIVHSGDSTGAAIISKLDESVRSRANLELFEELTAVELITSYKQEANTPEISQVNSFNRCFGAYLLDNSSGAVLSFAAKVTILACGGASRAYLYSTNPDGNSGDGIAMAWRAGCRVANLEFNQFHPTCLYHPHAKSLLITEAMRGEGGLLVHADGQRFLPKHHPRAELAPRDVVARAIDSEMKRLGYDCVYLDMRHKDAAYLEQRFPAILKSCLQFGIDIRSDLIPVVPSAHYTCGGIRTNVYGQTDCLNLYAIGEASCTGLHGANRLASNSLLECVVIGLNAAERIAASFADIAAVPDLPAWDASRVSDSEEDVVIAQCWEEVRQLMWNYVGIVRTTKRLLRARERLKLINREIREYYGDYRISPDLVELRNLALVAWLMVESALARKESRGLHYTLDYPETSGQAYNTILHPSSLVLL